MHMSARQKEWENVKVWEKVSERRKDNPTLFFFARDDILGMGCNNACDRKFEVLSKNQVRGVGKKERKERTDWASSVSRGRRQDCGIKIAPRFEFVIMARDSGATGRQLQCQGNPPP